MTPRTFGIRLSLFNGFLYIGSGMQLPFLPLWLKDRGWRRRKSPLWWPR